ncbi:MAG: dynamin family protein, partial [Chthoniobacteraceae bacterium]
MDIQDYTNKCNALADLAKQAIDLEGLDEKTKEELQQTRDSILANHYRITLLGSFQSGKSTIFNVACGGRELSPTGIGIRTSAVPAEAHVTTYDQEEYANVIWKTDRELLSGFIDAVMPELRDIEKPRFENCSEAEAVEKLDLSRGGDRELLATAIRDARQHLLEDSSAQSGADHCLRHGDVVELLKIGGLILHFYTAFIERTAKHPSHSASMTVEEASRVVRFPEDWSKMQDHRSVRWEDAQFLFARTVQFFLNSKDLRQLRAVLVDCPGLHASRWDNEIVHHCISQSDAVIWLQGGEGRELGQSDLEEAKRFGDYGITNDGVFLAFNARGVGKRISEKILDVNLTKMKTHAGVDVPP